MRYSGTFKNKGTSLRNSVPNCGYRKFRYGALIVATSCQLSSTKVDAQCNKLDRHRSNQADNTCDDRRSTDDPDLFIALSVHLYVQNDARRAGPSATADTCLRLSPSFCPVACPSTPLFS